MTQSIKLAGLRAPGSESPGAALPGVWRLGAARGGIEVKEFFRDKMAVAFIFGLPSILLILLGSIFGSQAATAGVTVGQLFTAGMIAGGIMATSFQYLGIGIATERENGRLKRLSGTPMPRPAYFAGKLVQVLVCTVAETALLMAVGMLFYHLHLPTSPGRWWTFAWVFVLGTAACSLLGVAASSVPRSAASATPVITLPFTVLQFISGVYVPFTAEPGIEVAGEAASGPEAVARARTGGYDVILMDLRMPGGDGVAATEQIIASSPGARILILTTYETDADILRAVEAGATGYLLKDATPAELAGAVRAAARGETVLAPSVAERLVTHVRRPPRESLSARETEVLALVARGRTNAEIGRALFISEATVKTHLLRAFGKLGVSGRTAAVTTAIERGLLPPPGGNQ